jgi:hypothetical protein
LGSLAAGAAIMKSPSVGLTGAKFSTFGRVAQFRKLPPAP